MEKCDFCIIGTYMESYYDYGVEDLMFENCIDLDKNFFKGLDVFTLYNYCPICGNKNNLEKYRGFTPSDLENYTFTGVIL